MKKKNIDKIKKNNLGDKMNNKVIGALIVIAIILIIGIPQYQSYQDQLLSEHFNETLQNASSIESSISTTTQQFNNQNSTDVDVLMNTINNDITPKYSEELLRLNETGAVTNNDTEKKYIDLQIKRVELQSKNLNATVTTLNAVSQYVKGEKTNEDAQNAINKANDDATSSNNELNQTYNDIKTLLAQNPDLNKKVHDLNLDPAFYGEPSTQAQAQNVNNTTTTQ